MRVALLALLLAACTQPAIEEEDPAKDKQIAELIDRVNKLEQRLKVVEERPGRGKTPTKKPQPRRPEPDGPLVAIKLTGDATKVLLAAGGERKWRLPGRVPAGEYSLLAAFGEGKLERRSKIYVREGEPMSLNCMSSTESCSAN